MRPVSLSRDPLAQRAEGNGQHQMVADYIVSGRSALERAGIAAVTVESDRHQLLAQLDGPRGQFADHTRDDLVVSSFYVVLLVRSRQHRKILRLISTARAVVVAEYVDKVERRLPLGRTSVLAEHVLITELAERRAHPARNVLVNPVDNRHPIPLQRSLVVVVVARGKWRLLDRVIEKGPREFHPVRVELLLRVVATVEPINVVGVGRGDLRVLNRKAEAA